MSRVAASLAAAPLATAAPRSTPGLLAAARPGDRFEIEADRAAERAGRFVRAAAAPRVIGPAGGGSTAGGGAPLLPPVAARLRAVIDAPGAPLAPAVRRALEPAFGHDFGRVRVHADAAAAGSARLLAAKAYAVGDHVVFGAGRFAPHSAAGLKLLAHELAHVAQAGPTDAACVRRAADEAAGDGGVHSVGMAVSAAPDVDLLVFTVVDETARTADMGRVYPGDVFTLSAQNASMDELAAVTWDVPDGLQEVSAEGSRIQLRVTAAAPAALEIGVSDPAGQRTVLGLRIDAPPAQAAAVNPGFEQNRRARADLRGRRDTARRDFRDERGQARDAWREERRGFDAEAEALREGHEAAREDLQGRRGAARGEFRAARRAARAAWQEERRALREEARRTEEPGAALRDKRSAARGEFGEERSAARAAWQEERAGLREEAQALREGHAAAREDLRERRGAARGEFREERHAARAARRDERRGFRDEARALREERRELLRESSCKEQTEREVQQALERAIAVATAAHAALRSRGSGDPEIAHLLQTCLRWTPDPAQPDATDRMVARVLDTLAVARNSMSIAVHGTFKCTGGCDEATGAFVQQGSRGGSVTLCQEWTGTGLKFPAITTDLHQSRAYALLHEFVHLSGPFAEDEVYFGGGDWAALRASDAVGMADAYASFAWLLAGSSGPDSQAAGTGGGR